MTEPQQDRVEINWVQVSASALAAVSSAVLLSTVGVAGTLIGAAIGSIFATVGSSIYSHFLGISRARVAAAQTAALERLTHARSGASGVWADTRRDAGHTVTLRAQRAADELDDAERELESAPDEARPAWREVLADLPWKRIAAVAGGIFVVAMLVIVSFELVTGRAVSTYTGGTDAGTRSSIPGLGAKHSSGTPAKTPAPTHGTTPSPAAPSSTPTPSETPTPSPSATPTQTPTTAPSTVAPSTAPSTVPSAVPTPTEGATPAG